MNLNPFKPRQLELPKKGFAAPVRTTTTLDTTGEGSYGVSLFEDIFASNSVIYQTQPNVRTVVDFIARNVAQVNIKLYDRVSDTERVELSDHPLTDLLQHPNPVTTRYRMIYGTIADLAIYDACFWIKQRSGSKLALVRVPPEYMTVYGAITPKMYRLWFPGGDEQFFSPDEVVHFHGYHPTKLNSGVSPMETLRNIIAEDVAASNHRRSFWKRGARIEGIIMRPSTAPELSVEGRKRFLEEWEAATSGSGNAGKTGLLEEDMKWEAATFSPKETEYIAGRQLTMAQVARAFHVPLPMVGLTDSANFASIKEYHTMLYQECLPPWMTWIQEDIELQLFPEFSNLDNAYAEFNIAEKLRGSFEESAAILTSAVGGPYMTIEEARARLNLPNDEESLEKLITPLNVISGGGPQPAPNVPTEVPTPEDMPDDMPPGSKALPHTEDHHDWHPYGKFPNECAPCKSQKNLAEIKALAENQRDKYTNAHEEVLKKFFIRQRDVMLSNEKAAKAFDTRRWNKELREDLTPLALQTTISAGSAAARRFDGEYDPDKTVNYLDENVRIAAENINAQTKRAIQEAGEDGLRHVFEVAIVSRAAQLALSRSTSLTSFATHEAAKQNGRANKVWIVTNPKSRHPEMDGETVPLNTAFSNGLQYPGDPTADSDETAHCQCLLDFTTS